MSEDDSAGLGRRGLLRAIAASATLAAASSALGAMGCTGETDQPSPPPGPDWQKTRRIDTHHHVLTPKMKQWMVDQRMIPPNSDDPWTKWNLEEALRVMDNQNIQTGVASMPAPSEVFLDATLARSGIRVMNDSLSELAAQHPTRFGFLAYLPLAQPNLALEEIALADKLGADGFLLMNHVENRYLGDPVFEPMFAELNRRRAVIMTHPSPIPGDVTITPHIPEHIGDFMLDTTRGALGMMFSGVLDRYPDITIILPHGGGFLPYVAERISHSRLRGEGLDPGKVEVYLRRFYYDTAGPMSVHMTPTLLATTDSSHLLYGTDYHQLPEEIVAEDAARLASDPALDARARANIGRENALRLFPKLAARL